MRKMSRNPRYWVNLPKDGPKREWPFWLFVVLGMFSGVIIVSAMQLVGML